MGVNGHAVGNFLDALANDFFIGFETAGANSQGTDLLAKCDLAKAHGVVWINDSDLILALSFEYRSLRHKECTGLNVSTGADFRIHAGTKNIAGIGKKTLDYNSAGLDIDLAVGDVKVSGIWVSAVVSQDHREGGLILGGSGLLMLLDFRGETQILTLADREADLNRIELGDGSK